MSELSRESRLNAAFVTLADTLTEDYDVVDLLHTLVEECTAIFDTQAGGLMLADDEGRLQLIASTSEQAELVEIMQLNAGSGPCVECFESGQRVAVADIAASGDRWPAFRDEALKQGFRSIHATPMKLRGRVIGTLNLLGTSVGDLTPQDADAAQALSDVATIGILQERVIRESSIVADQLHRALDSRILIEQAKGVLSQTASMSMDEAFAAMRTFARSHNFRLRAVAQQIVDRSLDLSSGVRQPRSSA
jgi:GAF domain-containing protein